MFRDYTVSGEVTRDGRLELADRAAFSKAMRHFTPGPVTVRIERDSGKRSTQANRYLWLIYNLVADETGHEPEEIHEFCKRKFLDPDVVTVFGEDVAIWTTADKDPERFTKYTEDVREFFRRDFRIETPDPDPALRGRSRHAKRRAA